MKTPLIAIALILAGCSATQADWNVGDKTQSGWTYQGNAPCSTYYGQFAVNNNRLFIECEDRTIFSIPINP